MTSMQIYVNLAVKDLKRSIEFFRGLGFSFNPKFTDENASCMIVGDNIFVMLLAENFFKSFTNKPLVDAKKATEVLVAFSCASRAQVSEIVSKAVARGARTPLEPKDYGFMFQHGFEDLDGHMWELFHMNPSK